jgi:hypothetical protein
VDTRTKIVSTDEAVRASQGGALIVSGYFDPMTAAHAERLEALKQSNQRLLVLIATPDDPILPARARAELIAALRIVDHVAEYTEEIVPHVRLEQEDRERRERLIEHVHARQQAAATSGT